MKLERRRGQALGTNCKPGQPNPDTWKEHRVGQNVDAKEIDEDRCVADPGCRYLGIIPFQRLWFGESGRDWAPTFDCPFTPKVPEPTPHPPALQGWLFGRGHTSKRIQGDVGSSLLARAE